MERIINMKKVLVVLPVEERHRIQLESISDEYEFSYCTPEETTPEYLSGFSVIVGCVPPDRIKASPRLELLQLNSAGADNYIKEGILSGNTILANATGAYNKTVAEHTFAVTMMLMKKLEYYRDNQAKSLWKDMGCVSSFENAVVVIAGFGDIGKKFGNYAKAFGAYVIGVKRRFSEKPENVDELVLTEEIDSVLPRADIIVSFLPQTPSTVHFYTEERFRRMKPSAIFVNCGRGSAVASDVLYKVMSENVISAAAIDVTETEPLGGDSPLWGLDNLVITPHVAGGYHLPDTLDKIVEISCNNLKALKEKKPLCNVVDFTTGYKK